MAQGALNTMARVLRQYLRYSWNEARFLSSAVPFSRLKIEFNAQKLTRIRKSRAASYQAVQNETVSFRQQDKLGR